MPCWYCLPISAHSRTLGSLCPNISPTGSGVEQCPGLCWGVCVHFGHKADPVGHILSAHYSFPWTRKITLTCSLLLTPCFLERTNIPTVGMEMELIRDPDKRDRWEKCCCSKHWKRQGEISWRDPYLDPAVKATVQCHIHLGRTKN